MRIKPDAWLQHLDDARVLALAGDVEGVHQVRVAARRLRVWVALSGRHRRLQRELRWLCRALAALRDLDVFGLSLTGEARIALREAAEAEAFGALQSRRWVALRAALKDLRPPRVSRARRRLEKLEVRLHAFRAAEGERDGEAVHRLRRALRSARYAGDWLGLDTAHLAQEQELLGAQCDLLALEAFAQRHRVPAPPALREGIARGFALLTDHWVGGEP